MKPWASFLLRAPDYKILQRPSSCSNDEEFTSAVEEQDFSTLFHDPLFLHGLSALHALDPKIEKALTYLRRYCLVQFFTNDFSVPLDFLAAMGLHCFFNEYVFWEEPEEKKQYQLLEQSIADTNPDDEKMQKMAALFSCYKPLFTLPNASALLKTEEKTECILYQKLMKRQIREPLTEQALKVKIPTLTPVKNTISDKVRHQYEENPYPRWHTIPGITEIIADPQYGAEKTILNAGCGTGQAPISAAILYPKAQITSLDLSLSSLAYAKRKAKEMGINNIEFMQADILELSTWDKKFDIIMSNGVLHHMEDPMAGWHILTGLLKPESVMFISLYSELARQDIVKAHKWIQQHNIPYTEDGIRTFRKHILSCDKTDPLKKLTTRPDFYSLSSCRDLIFHIMEHRITCMQLHSMLVEQKLKFIGFDMLPSQVQLNYQRIFPDNKNMDNLENWDKLEQSNPDIFNSMYSFWCCHEEGRPEDNMPDWMK